MRQPGTVTIVATIKEGMESRLRDFLKLRVDMNEDGSTNDVDFTQLGDLHFCAMFIVDADQILDKPALLVIEATIDGGVREFLENLIDVSPPSFAHILECCEGFPASSMRLCRLAVDYLMLRIVKYKTHYCGYPGRTVSQIKGEQKLRSSLRDFLSVQNKNTISEPPTYAQIHRNLKRHIRNDETLNWAVQKSPQPDAIKHRRRNIFLLLTILLGFPTALIMVWSFRFWALSPVTTYEVVSACVSSMSAYSFSGALAQNCFIFPEIFGPFVNSLAGIFLYFVIIWAASKIINSIFVKFKQRRRKAFSLEIASLAITLVNIVSLVCLFLVGYLIFLNNLEQLGVFSGTTNTWKLVGALAVLGLAMGFFSILGSSTSNNNSVIAKNKSVTKRLKKAVNSALAIVSFVAYYTAFLAMVFIAFNLILSFLRSVINWGEIAWDWGLSTFGVAIFRLPSPEFFASVLSSLHLALEFLTLAALSTLPFVLAGIILLISVAILVLLLAQILETMDRHKYQDSQSLVGNRELERKQIYAREEHGYNTNQNHLISVVHVKKGVLRRTFLRVTFWVINLLAETVFNRGTLGGIPTILSARWMLIDNGTRVVFMTNYVGAWDSYINEFLDLEGVRGVNAIWTNTAQTDPHDPLVKKLIAFPKTKFLLWGGAENEKQFKAYIRASQVETLVWYGAYPDLSVSNINNNSALRERLFDELTSAQMDELTSRL